MSSRRLHSIESPSAAYEQPFTGIESDFLSRPLATRQSSIETMHRQFDWATIAQWYILFPVKNIYDLITTCPKINS